MTKSTKSFDLIVLETKDAIVRLINESGLPLSVTSMVLKDVQLAVDGKLNSNIAKELQAPKDVDATKTPSDSAPDTSIE